MVVSPKDTVVPAEPTGAWHWHWRDIDNNDETRDSQSKSPSSREESNSSASTKSPSNKNLVINYADQDLPSPIKFASEGHHMESTKKKSTRKSSSDVNINGPSTRDSTKRRSSRKKSTRAENSSAGPDGAGAFSQSDGDGLLGRSSQRLRPSTQRSSVDFQKRRTYGSDASMRSSAGGEEYETAEQHQQYAFSHSAALNDRERFQAAGDYYDNIAEAAFLEREFNITQSTGITEEVTPFSRKKARNLSSLSRAPSEVARTTDGGRRSSNNIMRSSTGPQRHSTRTSVGSTTQEISGPGNENRLSRKSSSSNRKSRKSTNDFETSTNCQIQKTSKKRNSKAGTQPIGFSNYIRKSDAAEKRKSSAEKLDDIGNVSTKNAQLSLPIGDPESESPGSQNEDSSAADDSTEAPTKACEKIDAEPSFSVKQTHTSGEKVISNVPSASEKTMVENIVLNVQTILLFFRFFQFCSDFLKSSI